MNRLFSVNTLKDESVRDMKDVEIGKIIEFMIDPIDGKIEYAVMSFGGFLGMGDKYFAIPWQAFELDKKETVFKLNVTKEKLENSPGFSKDNWPDFADSNFLSSIVKSYDVMRSQ